jgi:hypothetical protein
MDSFCTIVNFKYLPQAQVLINSFRAVYPDHRFVTLITDIETLDFKPLVGSEVLTVKSLKVDEMKIQNMRLIYDVVEFATAMKPYLLIHLLADSVTATYLDPDVLVFSPLDFATIKAKEFGVVVTPHRLTPSKQLTFGLTELTFLKYGTFNLGFISVGQSGYSMLNWWSQRLEFHSTRFPNGYVFTDQKWIDLLPSFFDHFILKDPGYNFAPWNIDERNLWKFEDVYFIDNSPLVFIHFSQMSDLLANGQWPDHWLSNFENYPLKDDRIDLIHEITDLYRQELLREKARFGEFSYLRIASKDEFFPWPKRQKMIEEMLTGSSIKIRHNSPKFFFIKLQKLLFRSSLLVGAYQGLREDLKRLRARSRRRKRILAVIGGTKSDF